MERDYRSGEGSRPGGRVPPDVLSYRIWHYPAVQQTVILLSLLSKANQSLFASSLVKALETAEQYINGRSKKKIDKYNRYRKKNKTKLN